MAPGIPHDAAAAVQDLDTSSSFHNLGGAIFAPPRPRNRAELRRAMKAAGVGGPLRRTKAKGGQRARVVLGRAAVSGHPVRLG